MAAENQLSFGDGLLSSHTRRNKLDLLIDWKPLEKGGIMQMWAKIKHGIVFVFCSPALCGT